MEPIAKWLEFVAEFRDLLNFTDYDNSDKLEEQNAKLADFKKRYTKFEEDLKNANQCTRSQPS